MAHKIFPARLITAFRTIVLASLLTFGPDASAAVFMITSTGDSGPGTLRQAILDANASPGRDILRTGLIDLNTHPVMPLSALPPITESIQIEGRGMRIDGVNAGPVSGLIFLNNVQSKVFYVIVEHFQKNGIEIIGGQGNEFRMIAAGSEYSRDGNGASGFYIEGGQDHIFIYPEAWRNHEGMTLRGGSGHQILNASVAKNSGDGIVASWSTFRMEPAPCYSTCFPPPTIASMNGGAGLRLFHSDVVAIDLEVTRNAGSGMITQGGNTTIGSSNFTENQGDGISAIGGVVSLRYSTTSGNAGLGLDRGDDGVDDSNHFPFLIAHSSPWINGRLVTVEGQVAAPTDSMITVSILDNPLCEIGDSEGANFVGEFSVRSNSSGKAGFRRTFHSRGRGAISANVTTEDGETSEFSHCVGVVARDVPVGGDVSVTPSPSTVSAGLNEVVPLVFNVVNNSDGPVYVSRSYLALRGASVVAYSMRDVMFRYHGSLDAFTLSPNEVLELTVYARIEDVGAEISLELRAYDDTDYSNNRAVARVVGTEREPDVDLQLSIIDRTANRIRLLLRNAGTSVASDVTLTVNSSSEVRPTFCSHKSCGDVLEPGAEREIEITTTDILRAAVISAASAETDREPSDNRVSIGSSGRTRIRRSE